MPYGQTILTIGAVILFSIHAMTAHRMYNMAVERSVETQEITDALDYGRALNDRVQAYSLRYWTLMDEPEDGGLNNLDEVTDPTKRLEFQSSSGETYFATIEIGDEESLMFNQSGRMVTIRVFQQKDGQLNEITRYQTAVMDTRLRGSS